MCFKVLAVFVYRKGFAGVLLCFRGCYKCLWMFVFAGSRSSDGAGPGVSEHLLQASVKHNCKSIEASRGPVDRLP